MKLTININLDGAAFDGSIGEELLRILNMTLFYKLGHEAETQDRQPIPLFDSNGNKVGKAVVRGE